MADTGESGYSVYSRGSFTFEQSYMGIRGCRFRAGKEGVDGTG